MRYCKKYEEQYYIWLEPSFVITKLNGKYKMALCGFNEEMIEGLDSFHKGLIEIIIGKSLVNKKEEKSLLEEKEDAYVRI